MAHWDRRELNKLVAESPEEYKKRFPEPFSAMIPEDASSENKLATEAYVNEHGGGGSGSDPEAVKYTEQTLTEEQKAQALANIGGASAESVTAETARATAAEEDIMDAMDGTNVEVVTALPTASASTVGKFYYVGPDGNGEYARYRGIESGGSYSFLPVGSTQIDLSTYATEGEVSQLRQEVTADVSQLEAKVDDISTGKYYGYYATAADLPDDATVDGFAYVGSGPAYTIYNCEGGVWTSTGITVNQSPVGNDEDIDQNEDGKLQFANRTYNSLQPNGMGYKILRKDASFASQVTDTNTIYEIRYKFDLNDPNGDNSVTIPAGCVLKFDGGMLTNGTIVLNNTYIDSPERCFDGITFDANSTIKNDCFRLSWCADENTNCTDAIQGIIDFKAELFFDLHTIIINKPIVSNARMRRIRGLAAAKSQTEQNASNGTMIVAGNDFSVDSGYSAFFVFAQTQGRCDIKNLFFDGSYRVGSGFVFSGQSASGEVHHNSFYRLYGGAIVVACMTEGIYITDNYFQRTGCPIFIGGNYDPDNLLGATKIGATNIVFIERNYSVYSNYGLIVRPDSDIHIKDNQISHTSCYCIWGVTGRLFEVTGNYFEAPGLSSRWYDSEGEHLAVDAYTTVPHLVGEHYGENGQVISSGWGIGTSQIRPAIFISSGFSSSVPDMSSIVIENNYFACNYVRTNIGDSFSNTIAVAGLDAVILVGSSTSKFKGNVVPFSAASEAHYGHRVSPKYLVGADNTHDGSNSLNELSFKMEVGSLPSAYSGTNWFYSRSCVVWYSRGQLDFVPAEFENVCPPELYNSVRNNYSNTYGNIYLAARDIIKKENIMMFRPNLNEYGSSNWYLVRIPISQIRQTSLAVIKVYSEESSEQSVPGYLKRDSTTISENASKIKNGELREMVFVLDKDLLSGGTNAFLEIHLPKDKLVYVSLPYVKTIQGEYNTRLYGVGCDEDGFLVSGTTAQRPPVAFAYAGQEYLDTTLGKKIMFDGTNWVNLDGTALS